MQSVPLSGGDCDKDSCCTTDDGCCLTATALPQSRMTSDQTRSCASDQGTALFSTQTRLALDPTRMFSSATRMSSARTISPLPARALDMTALAELLEQASPVEHEEGDRHVHVMLRDNECNRQNDNGGPSFVQQELNSVETTSTQIPAAFTSRRTHSEGRLSGVQCGGDSQCKSKSKNIPRWAGPLLTVLPRVASSPPSSNAVAAESERDESMEDSMMSPSLEAGYASIVRISPRIREADDGVGLRPEVGFFADHLAGSNSFEETSRFEESVMAFLNGRTVAHGGGLSVEHATPRSAVDDATPRSLPSASISVHPAAANGHEAAAVDDELSCALGWVGTDPAGGSRIPEPEIECCEPLAEPQSPQSSRILWSPDFGDTSRSKNSSAPVVQLVEVPSPCRRRSDTAGFCAVRLSGIARACALVDAQQNLRVGDDDLEEELEEEEKGPEEGRSADVEERETANEVAKTEVADDAGASARTSEGASQLRGSTSEANEMPEILAIVQTTCATLAERLKNHLLEQQSNPSEPSRSVHAALSGARLSPAAALAAQATRRLLGEVEAAAYLRPQGTCTMHANTAALHHSECVGSAFQDGGLSPQWFDVSTPPLASRGEGSIATSAAGSSFAAVVGGAEGSHGCSTNSAASCCDICGTIHLDERFASCGRTPREGESLQVLSGRKCLSQSH